MKVSLKSERKRGSTGLHIPNASKPLERQFFVSILRNDKKTASADNRDRPERLKCTENEAKVGNSLLCLWRVLLATTHRELVPRQRWHGRCWMSGSKIGSVRSVSVSVRLGSVRFETRSLPMVARSMRMPHGEAGLRGRLRSFMYVGFCSPRDSRSISGTSMLLARGIAASGTRTFRRSHALDGGPATPRS